MHGTRARALLLLACVAFAQATPHMVRVTG